MKKIISLIFKKAFLFSLFLFIVSVINSMGQHQLPVKYYARKKVIKPFSNKASDIFTQLQPKFFIVQPKEGAPIEVPQAILELSNIIKNMLLDLGNTIEKPIIPLELYSRNTLAIIFNDILPKYKADPKNIALYLENVFKNLTLEELIDITNTLDDLDIHPLDNSTGILPIFIKKIFDVVINLSSHEIIAYANTIIQLHPDLQKSLVDYIIPYLKNRIIELYGNDPNRRTTILEESFSCVAFSPDCKRFVTGSLEELILRDTKTSKKINAIKGSFTNVVFSPDGTRIIATSDRFNGINDDGLLIIYNTETLEKINQIPIPQNTITTLAISPDETKIACGISPNKSLIIWDSFTLQQIAIFKDHRESIATIAFSPNSKQMISGCSKYKSIDNLILWDVQTYQKITNFGNYSNCVESVKFSPDGEKIIVGGFQVNPFYEGKNTSEWVKDIPTFLGYLTIWNAQTHQEIISLRDVKGRNISTVSFSPDGTYIASGNSWEILALRNAQTFEKIIDLDVQVPITNLVFSPAGKQIFYSNNGSRGRRGLFAWTLLTEKDIQALNDFKISDSAASVNATILIHRLCSAIEKGITINLSPEELDVFNTLPDFVKELLKNDTPKQAPEKPASPISIQPTYSTQDLGKRITITEKLVTTAPSFMQKIEIYGEKLLRWLRDKQNK